jgi:hypothetical protein
MTKPSEKQFPVFVFTRQRDIELETGLTLAGHLIVDIPLTEADENNDAQRILVEEVVQHLTADAQSGRMPDDAFLIGWPEGGGRPANAVDMDDDALMKAWAETRLRIVLRVDPRNDGMLRIDSDLRKQAGLPESSIAAIPFPHQEHRRTTTKPIPLDALIRRASRTAEGLFDKTGGLPSFYLVENAAGQQERIVAPIVVPEGMHPAKFKNRYARELRKRFRGQGVVRYAHVAEAWTVNEKNEAATAWMAEHGTWKDYPNRREIVIISAQDRNEYLCAKRDIIRPAGGKPYLGKLSDIERPTRPKGRLVNMLSDDDDIRSSSELADDEGAVFVAHVPDAPLLIIGRRDPATGELCVGRVCNKNESHLTAAELEERLNKDNARKHGIEVVTGPEAEQLIARVQRRLSAGH